MKVDFSQDLISPTEEVIQIQISFNPQDPIHEGYAAMIHTIIDTVNRILILEKALEDYDSKPE